MALAVDDRALVLRLAAPENEDKILALAIQRRDHRVGERLPSLALMRSGAPVFDRQAGVQQQHALPCPAFEIAMAGVGYPKIGCQFLVDVLKRWRWGHAMRHGKAEPMRLARPVIGILAKDHDLHIVEGRQLEGPENLASWRIYAFAGRLFGAQELAQPCHMR